MPCQGRLGNAALQQPCSPLKHNSAPLHHNAAVTVCNQLVPAPLCNLLLIHVAAAARETPAARSCPAVDAGITTAAVAIAAWALLAAAALLLWQAAGRCWVAYHWPHRLLPLILLVALLVLLAPQVPVYQLLLQQLHLQQTIPANHTQQNDEAVTIHPHTSGVALCNIQSLLQSWNN